MLSLIPIKFWFHNTHRVYTLCLNSARCVCVHMRVCGHPYLVIMQSNSDSELLNIYHPHPPHLPNCFLKLVNKAMGTHAVSTTMNICLERNSASAVVFLIWVRGSSFRIYSFLVKWPQPKLQALWEPKQFHKNGQTALGVAYSCSKIPSSNGPACGHLLHGRKPRVLRVRADLAIITWCALASPPSELYAFLSEMC